MNVLAHFIYFSLSLKSTSLLFSLRDAVALVQGPVGVLTPNIATRWTELKLAASRFQAGWLAQPRFQTLKTLKKTPLKVKIKKTSSLDDITSP